MPALLIKTVFTLPMCVIGFLAAAIVFITRKLDLRGAPNEAGETLMPPCLAGPDVVT